MTLRRLLCGAAALTLLGLGAVVGVPAAAAVTPPQNAVRVTVLDMTPTTPAYTPAAKPLTITLSLTNTTDLTLQQVGLNVERDVPITDPNQLEQLFGKPAVVDESSATPLSRMQVDQPLAPHETRTVVYRTTTSSQSDPAVSDICLCYTGVYPINFTVQAAENAEDYPTDVGFGQTYLPSFQDKPTAAAQVGWLWPLIDRPHRLTSDTQFLDDDLATSVAPGGRLYRALQVAAQVAAKKVRMTLVIDPDLIDELVVMSTGYTVADGTGRQVAGTGGAVAKAWLAQLKAVLPSHDVDLTPYADPDTETLAEAGTSWTVGAFTPTQQARVESVVGTALADIAWPPTGTVSERGVEQLLRSGVSTIVTSDASFTAAAGNDPRLQAVAPLPVSLGAAGSLTVVTDSTLQRLAGSLTGAHRTGLTDLPELVSDLAVRVAQNATARPFVAITPDRHVDADPMSATRTILETAATSFSVPTTVRQATQSITPAGRGDFANPAIPAQLTDYLQDAASRAAQFHTDLTPSLSTAASEALFRGLPAAIQRAESAGWATTPAAAERAATQLNGLVDGWQSAVYVARPANGSYTLASASSPLFVTVVNMLSVPVKVKVAMTTADGVIGFHADDIGAQEVPADGQHAVLRVPVHVQRSGRFTIAVAVTTAAGVQLGEPVTLNIRSTALGAIGVIITTVAGAVLVVALLVRVIHRRRHRQAVP